VRSGVQLTVFMARRRAAYRDTYKMSFGLPPVAEVTSLRRLRSASSSALVVPATRRSSLGDRAFAVAGPRAYYGTVYLSSSPTARHLSPSRN